MTIDLTPVLQAILGLSTVAISTFGTLALDAIARKYHHDVSAAQVAAYNDAISKSLAYAAAILLDKIKAHGLDHVETKNAVLDVAVQYAVDNFPGALQGVGLSTSATDPKNVATITGALTRLIPSLMPTPATPTPPVTA